MSLKELFVICFFVACIFGTIIVGLLKGTAVSEREVLISENARLHESLYKEQKSIIESSEEIIKVYDREFVDILLCCQCSRSCLGGVEDISNLPTPGGVPE
jgi:hypothetical protein